MFEFPLINAAVVPLRILGGSRQVSHRRRMGRGDKEGRRTRTKWSEIMSGGGGGKKEIEVTNLCKGPAETRECDGASGETAAGPGSR